MRAVLIRHGETEQNAHGIFQGYSLEALLP